MCYSRQTHLSYPFNGDWSIYCCYLIPPRALSESFRRKRIIYMSRKRLSLGQISESNTRDQFSICCQKKGRVVPGKIKPVYMCNAWMVTSVSFLGWLSFRRASLPLDFPTIFAEKFLVEKSSVFNPFEKQELFLKGMVHNSASQQILNWFRDIRLTPFYKHPLLSSLIGSLGSSFCLLFFYLFSDDWSTLFLIFLTYSFMYVERRGEINGVRVGETTF